MAWTGRAHPGDQRSCRRRQPHQSSLPRQPAGGNARDRCRGAVSRHGDLRAQVCLTHHDAGLLTPQQGGPRGRSQAHARVCPGSAQAQRAQLGGHRARRRVCRHRGCGSPHSAHHQALGRPRPGAREHCLCPDARRTGSGHRHRPHCGQGWPLRRGRRHASGAGEPAAAARLCGRHLAALHCQGRALGRRCLEGPRCRLPWRAGVAPPRACALRPAAHPRAAGREAGARGQRRGHLLRLRHRLGLRRLQGSCPGCRRCGRGPRHAAAVAQAGRRRCGRESEADERAAQAHDDVHGHR